MQLGFNDFLTRCEILDFDLDGKMVSQGKMTIRDITRMKVCMHPTFCESAMLC